MNTTNPDWIGPLPPEPEAGAQTPSIAPLYEPGADRKGNPPGFAIRYRQPHDLPDDTSDYVLGFANVCPHMGCRLVKAPNAPEEGQDEEASLIERFQEANQDRFDYSAGAGSDREKGVCGPCPCHGTTFDLAKQGLVILGPATQNLPMVKLKIQGGNVEVTEWAGPANPEEENWGTGFLNFVNDAKSEALQEFSGIGPAIAAAILAGRTWSSADALTGIAGISPGKLEQFKEWFDANQ